MLDVEALYREHHELVVRFLAKRTGDAGLADDLAQDVWLKVHRAAPRYEDRGVSTKAWVMTIAANRLKDHWREQRPRNLSMDEVGELEAVTEDAGADDQVEEIGLAALVEQLTPRQALVIRSRFLVGLNVKETSEAAGVSEDGAKKLQARGLMNLRRLIVEEAA